MRPSVLSGQRCVTPMVRRRDVRLGAPCELSRKHWRIITKSPGHRLCNSATPASACRAESGSPHEAEIGPRISRDGIGVGRARVCMRREAQRRGGGIELTADGTLRNHYHQHAYDSDDAHHPHDSADRVDRVHPGYQANRIRVRSLSRQFLDLPGHDERNHRGQRVIAAGGQDAAWWLDVQLPAR